MGLEERRAVSSALEEGGHAVRTTGGGGVLIWAFLLPQGSYWSSNHSEQGWLAEKGGRTGGGRGAAGTGVTAVSTVACCGLASSRDPLASKGPRSWGPGFAVRGAASRT